MQDWSLWHEAIKAAYSLGTAVVVLALGWLVGQRLTYTWNIRQRRRDFQLVVSQQFYTAYGEFFVVWKLWNRLERNVAGFEDRRWELHKRAAAAEAVIEGTLVKLSSELILDQNQINTLGCFRQAFQQLRQAIREDRNLPWSSSEHPEYRAFKTLTIYIAALLGSEWKNCSPSPDRAAEQFREITSNRWEGKWIDEPRPE